jgi:hypothetical protein
MSEARAPSKPAAGAVRGGLAGLAAAAAYSYVLEQTGSLELAALAAAAAAAALQYVGKLLRDRGIKLDIPV